MASKVLVATYEGVGGPQTSALGGDGFEMGPTDAGTYRVAYCGRHSSTRYRGWSTFRWGAAVKEEAGKVFVMHNGKWADIEDYGLDRQQVTDYSRLLYGVEKVPKKWVFNDFGHMTCYLYRDLNNDGRMDGKERIHGEFIHTTPEDEANTRLGLAVQLGESHGCIHVKPGDIDEMIKRGFLAKNNVVVVHRYTEARIPFARPKNSHSAPYELHFYPGLFTVCVVGVERL
jgi:hypothetical protein